MSDRRDDAPAEGRRDGSDAAFRVRSEPAPGRRALSPMARRVVISAMVGAAGALAAALLRGYRLDLALVTGVAVGLLAFATLRTLDRLRGLGRR
ncbi:MAG TPA: hypothetical protein VHQ65_17180 [Thermoanaerobaculia bacterium]|nr:hypothetical protein [Thermoanaerobaculia bacterium]